MFFLIKIKETFFLEENKINKTKFFNLDSRILFGLINIEKFIIQRTLH